MPEFKVAGKRDEHDEKASLSAQPFTDADLSQPGFIAVAGLSGDLPPLRRRAVADPLGDQDVSEPVVAALRQRRGRGTPLQGSLATPLEQHFGMDLSAVRVHADPGAGQIARSLQATAFTHGNDIYFAPGAYRPGSAEGQRVLAHEMSHVVAQRTGADSSGHGALTVGRADHPAETAADRSADRAMTALRRTRAPEVSPRRAVAWAAADELRPSPATGSFGYDGELVIRRYFDGWPASLQETPRKARFDAFVDNAVAAGISSAVAESAGQSVLQHWKGWTSHYADDFDHAWITGPKGFRHFLAERLNHGGGAAETLEPLLDEVFNANADQALLAQLGRAAGFDPGGQGVGQGLDLDPEWENEIIEFFAARFEARGDWKGQGDGFKAAWAHASDTEKDRVLVILLGPDWKTTDELIQSPHLSDLSYLVEGVIGGRTPKQAETDIWRWLQDPRGSLFEYMRNVANYQTKYMTEKERQEYRLELHHGRIYRFDGQPLVGDNIFVLSRDDVFYGGSKQSGLNQSKPADTDAIHHSSFLAGEPVNCAGHFITDTSGELKTVSDQSGHYAPTDYEFGAFLYRLKHHDGVDLETITFRQRNAAEFLRGWEKKNLPEEAVQSTGGPTSSFDENDFSKNPFDD